VKLRRVKDKDYSMHLLAIDSKTKVILGAFEVVGERLDGVPLVRVPAVTTNGRFSFLPLGARADFIRIQDAFRGRIEERYPKESCPDVCTYVCAAMVLVAGLESVRFIFEVWGFTEPMPELEQIYRLLAGANPGQGKDRTEVERFLSSKPVKSYVNALIDFLKKEMNWARYVSQAVSYANRS
jgi:hypothetical protein